MVKETFERFIAQYGSGFVAEHLKELWWVVQLSDEATIIATIERLSQMYDDPESAEIGLITVWQSLRG